MYSSFRPCSISCIIIYKYIIQYSTIVVSAGEVDTVAGVVIDVGVVDGEIVCSIEQQSIAAVVIYLTIVDCYVAFYIDSVICVYTISIII